MTATPPASWISPIASSASGQRRGTKAFAPGTRYSSKNGPRSPVAPAALAMWGRPIESAPPAPGPPGALGEVGGADRVGPARLADRVLEGQVETEAAQVLDDLPGPVA